MRSSMLVLFLLLFSARAAATNGGEESCASANPTATTTTTTGHRHPDPGHEDPSSIPTAVDPKLFSKRRRLSPRVLFSVLPPDEDPAAGGRIRRGRRGAAGESQEHRGVYSVCDSVSVWVGNKTHATDIMGNEVTVLPNVNINNVTKKQYFFETTCHRRRQGGVPECLGIDARHWNSYCTNSHTFVRALTTFKNLVAWRLIRIDVACVCVLSRKSWRQ